MFRCHITGKTLKFIPQDNYIMSFPMFRWVKLHHGVINDAFAVTYFKYKRGLRSCTQLFVQNNIHIVDVIHFREINEMKKRRQKVKKKHAKVVPSILFHLRPNYRVYKQSYENHYRQKAYCDKSRIRTSPSLLLVVQGFEKIACLKLVVGVEELFDKL